jgi:tetratricopeptide (TPR) repeat protein
MVNGTQAGAAVVMPHIFDADELLALARIDIEKGNIADALGRLKSATLSAQVPPGAYSICGQLYVGLGLWDHALKMFQKHLERHPESLGEKFSLGLALGNSGRAAEAMKIWDELLEKQPNYVPALYYRGLMRAQQSQFQGARQDLELLVRSAAGDDPYLKPGKELLQSIEARQSLAQPATSAAPLPTSDALAAIAKKAYSAVPEK